MMIVPQSLCKLQKEDRSSHQDIEASMRIIGINGQILQGCEEMKSYMQECQVCVVCLVFQILNILWSSGPVSDSSLSCYTQVTRCLSALFSGEGNGFSFCSIIFCQNTEQWTQCRSPLIQSVNFVCCEIILQRTDDDKWGIFTWSLIWQLLFYINCC